MKLKLRQSKYKHYLDENDHFRMWLENVERGAIATASEYIRRVGYVCDTFAITPAELSAMDEKNAGFFLRKVISHFEEIESAGTNIKGYVRGLKSWWCLNATL